MKTFVKILGPPIFKALKELEKVSVNMPDVCIMSSPISLRLSNELARDLDGYTGYSKKPIGHKGLEPRLPEFAWRYFNSSGILISRERCENIISNSELSLGEYDFYFEWKEKPKQKNIEELIEKIDSVLLPLGCLYKLVTR